MTTKLRMTLYVTPGSPYARMVRVVIIEKGLSGDVDIVRAQTRTPGSPYYAINPSGRVPFLQLADGTGFEDSSAIAAYLDRLAGGRRLCLDVADYDWGYSRLEARARSFTDGVSVWVREMRRPSEERSPTILAHEADRALRLADLWDREVAHPGMTGPLNCAQIMLIAGLDMAVQYQMGDYAVGRPNLAAWAANLREHPSILTTAASAAAE